MAKNFDDLFENANSRIKEKLDSIQSNTIPRSKRRSTASLR